MIYDDFVDINKGTLVIVIKNGRNCVEAFVGEERKEELD